MVNYLCLLDNNLLAVLDVDAARQILACAYILTVKVKYALVSSCFGIDCVNTRCCLLVY